MMTTLKQRYETLQTLIEQVKHDHPEYQEENTTGNDLINMAEVWLKEMYERLITVEGY